ncbi:MAG: type II toxin-antitoxin system HigB family toxin [Salibacteraceae bacterium]
MRLIGKSKLEKWKRGKGGNQKLVKAIDKLVADIERFSGADAKDLKKIRPDADKVHNDGFYFFNIDVHRTMLLIEFSEQEASIEWVGDHDQYERTFQNNKKVIENWLRSKELID